MKLAIFGATGSIGTQLVRQALAAGHHVTAFVRDPARLDVDDPGLRFVTGDVMTDPEQIRQAVDGQDAVLIALGAGARGRIRAEGTRNIIRAMQACGVERLICQSTLGAGESAGNLNFKWRFLFRVPLRLAMADHEAQERHVRESNLQWTIIRPSAFTDGPITGAYQRGFSANERELALSISRADVAQFMLWQLKDDSWKQQAVSISC